MRKIVNFLRSNNGSGEIIGLALVIIFVVIVPSGAIKTLGETIKSSFLKLNTDVNNALDSTK